MSPVLTIFQSHAYDTVWVNDNRLNCDPMPGVSTASTGLETSPTVPTGVTRGPGLWVQEREDGRLCLVARRRSLGLEQWEPGMLKQGSVSRALEKAVLGKDRRGSPQEDEALKRHIFQVDGAAEGEI